MASRSVEWHAANGDVIYFNSAGIDPDNRPYVWRTFFPGNSSGAAETARGVRTDGQMTFYVSIEPLTPSIQGTIIAPGSTHAEQRRNLDELRIRLQNALSPKHFGTLIYRNHAGAFRLKCRPIAGAVFSDPLGRILNYDIEWISDDPYWTEEKARTLSVGIIEKMWRFPWAIAPTVFGSILSEGVINNPTNIDIYPLIVISSTESSKITVGNRSTGESTTISHSIGRSQRLELDMSVPSAVLIDEDGTITDVMHWTTIDSVFPWAALPGENEIYSAVDNPEFSPIITLSWYQPLGGL